MINMQEDFIGALPAHAVPTSYVHLGRDDAERVRSGVLKFIKWHRALPANSDLFILHTMQTHDTAEVPTLKKYGGVHCVSGSDGWRAVSLAHLAPWQRGRRRSWGMAPVSASCAMAGCSAHWPALPRPWWPSSS